LIGVGVNLKTIFSSRSRKEDVLWKDPKKTVIAGLNIHAAIKKGQKENVLRVSILPKIVQPLCMENN